MAGRNCYNCVYSCHDPELWLRCLAVGEPLLPRCANHPLWPGRLHDVPGVPCRNYRPRPATPAGDVRMIPLGDGCYAYVDAADYEWLSRYHWRLCGAYAGRYEKGKTILMHREIMQPPKGMVVDHADGNKANNCRLNLRVCTRLENQRNKRKHSASYSRFKGVYRDHRYGKWYARCRYKGINYGLGCHPDEVAAARAYDWAAVAWFKEYARPNFAEEWPPERRAALYAQNLQPPPKKKKARKSAARKATRKKAKPPARRTKGRSRTTNGSKPKPKGRKRKTKPPRSRRKTGRATPG